MAIDISIARQGGALETARSGGLDSNQLDVGGSGSKGVQKPILGGESVRVTSGAMTDLEALVAKLKNENEATRQSVVQRKLSILSTVLDSMADRISAAERENILKLEELETEKSGFETQLAELGVEKSAAESRIAELDVKIAMLEKAVEREVQNGADHREQVEKLKRQRNEAQARLDDITASIKSVSAKIAGIDAKIAECSKSIASSTLSEVYAALRSAVGDDMPAPERTETQADRDRQAARSQATDIGLHLSAALDRLDGQIRAALDEAQMKVEG